MTVNTNGNKPIHIDVPSINSLYDMVVETRESQLRTEKLVTEFVESMSKNPMFATMAKMFGR